MRGTVLPDDLAPFVLMVVNLGLPRLPQYLREHNLRPEDIPPAALAWFEELQSVGSVGGSDGGTDQGAPANSRLDVTVARAAKALGLTSRAIRKRCRDRWEPLGLARQDDSGRWLIADTVLNE